MLLEYAEKLDAESILSEELINELFALEDSFTFQSKCNLLEDKSKCLGVLGKFRALVNAKKKDIKKKANVEVVKVGEKTNVLDYGEDHPALRCGSFVANEVDGVWLYTDKGPVKACPHPIYPSKVLVNAETGVCKLELMFKVRGIWRKIYVDRKTVASKTSIVQLADRGVQVTSDNASLLVKFLAEVEALNEDDVKEQISTSRLGWMGDSFMPYGDDVIFDNEQNLVTLFKSIQSVGSREKWFDCMRKLRQESRFELMIYFISSFASVLIEPCGALPFIVCLWGETGKGKTVALMVATSIWADPNEGAYMTDAKATTTAMEIRLNVLNSLPMTLDDMAQIKNQYDEDFSALIYRWCAGKGRDRSNQALGLNKLTSWRNCILTNAEQSLISETMQGGAINRIIDVEMEEGYLCDGQRVSEVVRNNFGFAGREFVDVVQVLGFEAIRDMQKGYADRIKEYAKQRGIEKEEKQILPMSIILTADELVEKHLFKDGIHLDFEKCFNLLKNNGEVSEHLRAYQYVKDTIACNQFRFKNDEDSNIEQWGYKDGDYWIVIGKVFDKILKEAGFQSKSFLSWCRKKQIVKSDSAGKSKINRKISGVQTRCVAINLEYDEEATFEPAETEDIPF